MASASYVYDGRTRKQKLSVHYQTSAGVEADGYPKVYLITNAFVNPGVPSSNLTDIVNPVEPPVNMQFYQITLLQLSRLSESEYQKRLAGFNNYVESLNPGLNHSQHIVPGYESTGTDATNCPIGEAATETQIIIS